LAVAGEHLLFVVDLAVGGHDQHVEVRGGQEIVGGVDPGLFVAGDFKAGNALVLGLGIIGEGGDSHGDFSKNRFNWGCLSGLPGVVFLQSIEVR
jgi:hypothetical protein